MAGWTNRLKFNVLGWVFRAVAIPTNFYAALFTSATAPTADTDTKGELTEIAAGNGYAAGGIQLSKNATGCDSTLNWWVTDYLNPPKVAAKPKNSKPKPKKRGARDFVMADLPKQCAQVLASR